MALLSNDVIYAGCISGHIFSVIYPWSINLVVDSDSDSDNKSDVEHTQAHIFHSGNLATSSDAFIFARFSQEGNKNGRSGTT